jgi:hypothetical protein
MDDVDLELPTSATDEVVSAGLSEIDQFLGRTSIFVHIVKYRLLCGRIMKSLHGLKRSQHDERAMYTLRDSLATELDSWWQNTRDLELPEVESSGSMTEQRSSFRSKDWYEVLYRNAMLMLFRPSPALSDISRDPETLEKIFSSSKQAVLLYASLHRSRKINYSWITLHSVFMAGLSYIYAVSRHFRERRRQSPAGAMLSKDPTTIEIVNDTRACSNVLVAVSERWNALRHCHEVFDKLSDAVLTDAIKLQCAPPGRAQPQTLPPTPSPHGNPPGREPNHSSSSYSNGMAPNTWYAGDGMALDASYYSQTSPLAVDSEFRNCFGDLQHLYNQPFADDPVVQLSHDWLGYLDGFDGMLPIAGQAQYQQPMLQ